MSKIIIDTCAFSLPWMGNVKKDILSQTNKKVFVCFSETEKWKKEFTEEYMKFLKIAQMAQVLIKIDSKKIEQIEKELIKEPFWGECDACDDEHIFSVCLECDINFIFSTDQRMCRCRNISRQDNKLKHIGKYSVNFKMIKTEQQYGKQKSIIFR
ncbi:hypothetical protein [Komagataeibacter oboediens]|uniref:PIN domain-containing protein n=1 Tax=Komagataeibacter oboediens TaxID=65958 RepID=A0ABS5SML1_9PROT|nr:hypothetical protein [Komagataeibacter oboediens]MBL7233149.1 hypothetical protein [Komagataeibacter oboediens]MBT0675433.1 hypothetical protein [Komagataeibacter oboediens]MBT0679680.1 hypothetical protein [Komagataeibacter oboediens]